MNIREAQKDMREAYYGGGPGALASGLIWILAGIMAFVSTKQISVLVFFFGGMLIYPLGILLSKLLKRSGKHKAENPFSFLAMESTALLFIGLFVAFFTLQQRPEWFFSIMILIIGGRYLMFNTLYGMRLYWIFGAVLIIAGVLGFFINPPFYLMALIGGLIELIFGGIIIFADKKNEI
jgi:hypothetical protein